MKDRLPPHKFGPGSNISSVMDAAKTHSLGIKPHPPGLFNQIMKSGLVKEVTITTTDERPLIDKLHEGTFQEQIGMQWIKDKYALRMLLRKAHCFTIDDETSRLIADFSLAIARDLESARQLAIPPFGVTWIDHNNVARLNRISEMGMPLTPTAAGKTSAGAPVDRVGWLIHPDNHIGGWFAHYVCHTNGGILMSPLAYWWHAASRQEKIIERPGFTPMHDHPDSTTEFIQGLTFGMYAKDINVLPHDAYPSPTPMHDSFASNYKGQVKEMMMEIAGELRHIWGLLIAINSTQFGAEARTTPQPLHTDVRMMPNRKPLLPIEHKILHLHLRKKLTPDKLVTRAITHHKNREHDVRGHFRTLRNSDGSVRKVIPIPEHKRGDPKLGKIIKTYKVEK